MNCACEGSEWRKIRSGLPLTPSDGELCNYFIMYHNAIIIEIKFTINVMHMNHFKTMPTPPSTSSHGKMVFHETGPCAKEIRDHCVDHMAHKHVGAYVHTHFSRKCLLIC